MEPESLLTNVDFLVTMALCVFFPVFGYWLYKRAKTKCPKCGEPKAGYVEFVPQKDSNVWTARHKCKHCGHTFLVRTSKQQHGTWYP